ncbi:hypothetical protein [Mycobacterium avium]|uniref:hypothetical protein n=1 Tax=Mycobacterium avium TaxID=1764 RepID=UPI0009FF68F1|nr:hypothetical protein [Mycobacterium avium]
MTWQQGHSTIVALIKRRHLEQISGAAADGQYVLEQASQRLASAQIVLRTDPVGAYNLAYDATRQACVSTLLQQGLRPLTAGGHVAIAEAVQAQFGEPFHFFNAMRRRRNKLEYPQNPADVAIAPDAVAEAISYAADTIHAVEQLLPRLDLWRSNATGAS